MFSIENDFLRVEFKALGAEMTRLFDKVTLEERLWSGDARFWGKQAPVLFPFVGSSKNGQYTYGDKTYPMGRHGFVREMTFEVIEKSATGIVFELKASDATRVIYPFEFVFQIAYALDEVALRTTYTVHNAGASEMIFSVGGHPAFSANYMTGTCTLEFEKEEALETIKINLETGLLMRKRESLSLEDRRLLLTSDTFKDDALIFENLQSKWVKLADGSHEKAIKLSIDGFPSLGIWSPDAPFVCIEPWQGTADYEDVKGRLEDKEGALTLMPHTTYTTSFVISLEA